MRHDILYQWRKTGDKQYQQYALRNCSIHIHNPIVDYHYSLKKGQVGGIFKLSDDKAIQDFTGIEPVVEEVEEVIEELSKDEEVTAEELSEEENTALVEDDVNSDVDGDIIVNTDKMKIYFIRISRNEEDEINLNLCIENKLNKDVIVQSKNVSVDGIITEPTFICNIKAEARVYEKMTFKNDIQQLVNFKGTFCLIDGGSTKVIDECTVSIFEE